MHRFTCQIAFLIALVTIVATEECSPICPAIWAPVCGSDGKSYDNECRLKKAACDAKDTNLKIAHVGECKKEQSDSAAPVAQVDDCPTSCLKNYDPVCATDGKTYSNECDMKLAGCRTAGGDAALKKDHDGPCVEEQVVAMKPCRTECTLAYAPLCGSDGTTYSNQCQLEVHNCLQQQQQQQSGGPPYVNVTVAHSGGCENSAPAASSSTA